MKNSFDVHLTLTCDTPNSMNFGDTYSGLADVWYKFQSDTAGNVTLHANADGFEHLARYFLKMARTGKRHGYHAHHSLEFGKEPQYPELTIAFVKKGCESAVANTETAPLPSGWPAPGPS